MDYHFYVNSQKDDRGRLVGFDGYQPGHTLRLAYKGQVDSADDLHACEYLFGQFNINHPADYRDRSMSVGDVVVLDGRAYACAVTGFQSIAMPLALSGG